MVGAGPTRRYDAGPMHPVERLLNLTALLLEASPQDARKALIAVRYARTRFSSDDWDDRIAAVAGREMLAYDDVDETLATKAVAA